MVGVGERALVSDKPDFHIRVNGLRVPVYKTPFTRATYQRMIMEGDVDRFAIQDQQKGRIKFYSFQDNKIPSYNVLFGNGMDMGLTSIAKIMAVVVMGVWAFRISRFTLGLPSLRPSKKQTTEEILNDLSGYENITKWQNPENGGCCAQRSTP